MLKFTDLATNLALSTAETIDGTRMAMAASAIMPTWARAPIVAKVCTG